MASYEQLKPLRKALNLTQTEFGERIGISRSAVNAHEQGKVAIAPDRAKAICSEFSVNPVWLETGKGEMFVKPANTFIDELAEKYNVDDFVKRALTAYMSLTDNEKATVKKFIEKLTPPPNQSEQKIYRAAKSADNHQDEITTLTKEEQERLAKATRMTSENSDL